jgi:LysM repeat protein
MHVADGVRRAEAPPPPPPPPPPLPPDRHVTHRVAPGETMTEVAARYSTDVATLSVANPQIQDPDRLAVGALVQVPIEPDHGSEPAAVEVQPGQTLSELAREVNLPVDRLVAANGHAIANPDLIHVGQQIWIPGGYAVHPAEATAPPPPQQPPALPPTAPTAPTPPAPAPSPLAQAATATDAAATRAAEAQRAHDDMAATTRGSGAALPYLAQQAADAERTLDAAVQAEIDLRVQRNTPPGRPPAEAEYAAAAEAIRHRTRTDPAVQQQLVDAVSRVDSLRQAQAIVTRADAQADPEQKLRALSDGHAAATPEVQRALLTHPDAQRIVQQAADWALEPLTAGPGEDTFSPQAPGLQTMERLDRLTAAASAEFGARVLAAARPAIEQAITDYPAQHGTLPFGPGSIEHLTHALGRVAGTPTGDAQMARYVELHIWDRNGIVNAMANGASPAYALAIARQPGVDAGIVMDTVYAGMDIYRERVADHTQAYAQHMAELAWLVKSHGGAMTPEQLDQAIADYTAEKGPAWQQQADALKQQLADDGARLLAQVQALHQLPPELSGERARVDETLAETLNDTHAQLAITTALQGDPSLTAGAAGQQLLGFFTSTGFASNAKLTDQARRLASEVATAHVQSTLLARVGEFDPADAASVQRAATAIDSLRSPQLARAWGVSEDALDDALDKLKATMPVAGERADDAARRLKDFDDALGGIKGLDKTTAAGQILRGAGLALAGVGVLASIERAGLDPSLRNSLRVLVDSAGLGQKGAELLAGLTKADSESLLGRLGGSAASKFLGVVTAAMDVWTAADSFANGDIPSGVLYGVGAGGGLLAAFGSGSLAGPIGIGLVVVSVVGLGIWNGVKQANQHEPGSDGGLSMRFLQHAGFSEEAARALCDQTGDGVSPVPIVARYAELKGLDLANPAERQRFVDWINAMPSEKLAALRDNLHRTLDEFEGDASRLPATADDDAWVVQDTLQRPWFAASGAARPESAAQIDAVLQVLELPELN